MLSRFADVKSPFVDARGEEAIMFMGILRISCCGKGALEERGKILVRAFHVPSVPMHSACASLPYESLSIGGLYDV